MISEQLDRPIDELDHKSNTCHQGSLPRAPRPPCLGCTGEAQTQRPVLRLRKQQEGDTLTGGYSGKWVKTKSTQYLERLRTFQALGTDKGPALSGVQTGKNNVRETGVGCEDRGQNSGLENDSRGIY